MVEFVHPASIQMSLPALSPLSPLASVLADINRCIEAKLFYPALLIALTIPEICAGLALPKSTQVRRSHYVTFVRNYTPFGDWCYQLRCGVVHRASLTGHAFFPTSHVLFTLPGGPFGLHALTIKNDLRPDEAAIAFDLELFCKDMIAAAHKWYEDNQNNNVVTENMKNLIRYAPDGIRGFIGGMPVVGSGPE